MLVESVPLASKPRLAGFMFCSWTLLVILLTQIEIWQELVATPAGQYLLIATALGVLGLVVVSVHKEPKPRPFWLGIFTAAFALSTWIFLATLESNHRPQSLSTLLISLSLALLMLSAFRATPPWYLGTAIAAAIVIYGVTSEDLYGVFTFVTVLGLWITLNYGVQLFLDHEKEILLILAKKPGEKLIAAGRGAKLMIPVLILVALGWLVHREIQKSLLASAYMPKSTISERLVDPRCGTTPVDAAKLERDINCTITQVQNDILERAAIYIDESQNQITGVATSTPEQTAALIQKLRPQIIEDAKACDGFRYGNKWVSLTFRSPCRGLIAEVNDALTRTHTQISAKINAAVENGSANLNDAVAGNADEFREAVKVEIESSVAKMRSANRAAFTGLAILEIVSLAILTISVVAAFHMLLGRLMFDKQQSMEGADRPVTFQLRSGIATSIEWASYNVLPLGNDVEGAAVWFATLRVSRRGIGSSMRVWIPQFASSFLQRFFTGNYVLTRLDVQGGPDGPELSAVGDNKLVRIRLRPGQSVCFRMPALVAFTEGVLLSSRYSTHVGVNMLGLGTFYTVAEGAGFLVLKTDGMHYLRNSDAGLSSPPSNLLAWDETSSFALDQSVTQLGIWLNEPSLIFRSITGSAVLDEGEPASAPLWRRAWALFRYFVLPI